MDEKIRRLKEELLWDTFAFLNDILFGDDPRIRFTLFDTADGITLKPFVRYQKGAQGGRHAAEQSRVTFRRGEGVIGLAWKRPGECVFQRMPSWNPANFVERQVEALMVPRATAEQLSNSMQDTRAIFACVLTDSRQRFLGALAVDFQMPLRYDPESQSMVIEPLPPVGIAVSTEETKLSADPSVPDTTGAGTAVAYNETEEDQPGLPPSSFANGELSLMAECTQFVLRTFRYWEEVIV